MKREIGDYVQDIIEAMGKAVDFVKGISFEEFVQDDKTAFAVVRALEIIGEAVKNIPDEVREKHPEIPWKGMSGMRNKVIHEYFGVDFGLIWKTIKERIPQLKPLLNKLLEDLEK
jgi:uncharacterized protein with HEPN domain